MKWHSHLLNFHVYLFNWNKNGSQKCPPGTPIYAGFKRLWRAVPARVLFLGGIHFFQAGIPPKRRVGKALYDYASFDQIIKKCNSTSRVDHSEKNRRMFPMTVLNHVNKYKT